MGCLLEFIFEFFGEIFFELIVWCYAKIMQFFIPEMNISEKAKERIKQIVTSISAILLFFVVIGIFLILQENLFVKKIGKFMTFIPLSILGLHVVLGMIIKIINHFKK